MVIGRLGKSWAIAADAVKNSKEATQPHASNISRSFFDSRDEDRRRMSAISEMVIFHV